MKRLLMLLGGYLQALSAGLNRVCWTSAVVLLLAMLFAVALQVVARYIFFSPPAWTEELARYCMVWAGFLGATVSFYKNADPVLATPAGKSTAHRSIYLGLRSAEVVLFLVPVIYWSPVLLSHHMLRETESMKLVSAYVFAIIPIFSSVILVHVLARLIDTATVDEESE